MIPFIGQKVVRGPDWASGDEDGGEGTIGTVISVADADSAAGAAKSAGARRTNGKILSVTVAWDSGVIADYSTGQDGKYDLSPIDVGLGGTHLLARCDICGETPSGFRWYCVTCNNYDLCNKCYNSDQHDLTHHFTRFVGTIGSSVGVPTRESSAALKLEAKGMFPGAKVSKDGSCGTVEEVVGKSSGQGERGGVKVQWEGESGLTTLHRNEAGDIGLQCEEPAVYGTYYKDHLPSLGNRNYLIVGDLASVLQSEDKVKQMQEGHGAWTDQMSKALLQVGIVVGISYRGDVKLHFPAITQEWEFNSEVVTRVDECGIGDTVLIKDDEELIKRIQAGHGEWDDAMAKDLGEEAMVLTVTKTGDVKVLVNGHPLTLHPACLTIVRVDDQRTATDWEEAQEVVMLKAMQDQLILGQLGAASSVNSKKEEIVKYVEGAFDGKLNVVKEYLEKNPSWINITVSRKTALHVACIKGHLDIVKYLVSKGANTEVDDEKEFKPLHCAVMGKHLKVAEHLLKQGVYVSAVCGNGWTPLHIAAFQNLPDFIALFVKHGGNINLQDKTGDTPLHLAICQSAKECQKVLIESPKVDLLLRNRRGHCPLHFAALFKSELAVNLIIEKRPELVNVRKDDGYAPFHVAAFNNHANIVKIFHEKGKCDIDMLTTKKETPLYLAIGRGGTETVEFLVSRGANINHAGRMGNTCLHLLVELTKENQYEVEDSLTLRKIRASMREIGISSTKQALACYLVKSGGDMSQANGKGTTPWDLVKDPKLRECLEKCIETRGEHVPPTPAKKPVNSLLARFLPFLNKDPSPAESTSPLRAQSHVHVHPEETLDIDDIAGSVSPFDIEGNANSPVYELATSPFDRLSSEPHGAVAAEALPLDTAVKQATDMGAGVLHPCAVCQQPITELTASPCQHVQPLSELSPASALSAPGSANARAISGLRRQNSELRTALSCTVCLQRKKAVVFECGHSTCQQCSELLPDCPVCRKPASKVFPLFL